MRALESYLAKACLLVLFASAPQETAGWQTVRGGPDAQCGLGDPYYFFARIASPDSLLVFFGGGGACWDAASCDVEGSPRFRPTVDTTSPRLYQRGILAFTNSRNPFKNYSMLVVSYCTGDLHLGSRTVAYQRRQGDSTTAFRIHHVGAHNVRAALNWISERVPSPTRIVVTGQSAGAIPTTYFAAILARQHPSAHVLQIGDAFGAFRAPRATSVLLRHWGADSMLVADGLIEASEAAPITFEDLYIGAVKVAPSLQIAQVNSVADSTQLLFLNLFGVRNVSVAEMLAANMSEIHAAVPGFRFFVVDGSKHVFLSSPDVYEATSEGVRLLDWIADLAGGRNVESVGRTLLSQSRTGGR